MAAANIGNATKTGRYTLPEDGELATFEHIRLEDGLFLDENDELVGYSVEKVFADVDKMLSERYGVDFAKVHEYICIGKLKMDELTDELLLSPEFKYEPYPGFKPKPLPADFKPNPIMLGAL